MSSLPCRPADAGHFRPRRSCDFPCTTRGTRRHLRDRCRRSERRFSNRRPAPWPLRSCRSTARPRRARPQRRPASDMSREARRTQRPKRRWRYTRPALANDVQTLSASWQSPQRRRPPPPPPPRDEERETCWPPPERPAPELAERWLDWPRLDCLCALCGELAPLNALLRDPEEALELRWPPPGPPPAKF